jgi:hypothetical protein
MWVVFRKSDRTVVGTSADAETDIEKEKALAEVVAGLESSGNVNDYDAFQVKERGTLASWAESAGRGLVRVEPTQAGSMSIVVEQAPSPSQVDVTTSATELHPVDNVPLVSADPESFVVITLQRRDQEGKALTGASEGGDEIWLRASYGILRADTDERSQEIRLVKLEGGTASFRLYSEGVKRLAIVQMLSANPNLQLPGLRVEFI